MLLFIGIKVTLRMVRPVGYFCSGIKYLVGRGVGLVAGAAKKRQPIDMGCQAIQMRWHT